MTFNDAASMVAEDTPSLTVTQHYDSTATSRKIFTGWNLSFKVNGLETLVFLADTTDEEYLKTGTYVEIDKVQQRISNALEQFPHSFTNQDMIEKIVQRAINLDIPMSDLGLDLD